MLNNSSLLLKARVITSTSIVVLLTVCGGSTKAATVSASGNTMANKFLAVTTTSTTYLSENALLSGNAIISTASASADYLGKGFVTHFWATNDSVTFTVNAAVAGEYDVGVRYQNANSVD